MTGQVTCHSCHYKRDDVINCAYALENGGRHAFCANCLRRRCNVDFHALRTGLVQWQCPVCHDACPCAQCKRKRGPGAQPQKYQFHYSDAVDTSLVSKKSGGVAEFPSILDFSGCEPGKGPTVIRLSSPEGAQKGRMRMHHATVVQLPGAASVGQDSSQATPVTPAPAAGALEAAGFAAAASHAAHGSGTLSSAVPQFVGHHIPHSTVNGLDVSVPYTSCSTPRSGSSAAGAAAQTYSAVAAAQTQAHRLGFGPQA